jgi:hypothetical protein
VAARAARESHTLTDRRTPGAAAFHATTPVRLDSGMPVSADREELFELRV